MAWFTLSAGGLCREVAVFWRSMFFPFVRRCWLVWRGRIDWTALVFRVAV